MFRECSQNVNLNKDNLLVCLVIYSVFVILVVFFICCSPLFPTRANRNFAPSLSRMSRSRCAKRRLKHCHGGCAWRLCFVVGRS